MRTTIRGRSLAVSEADRDYIQRKMRRLERMLDDDSDAEVDLRLEGNSKVDDSHVVDVTIRIDGGSLRGTAAAGTFRVAADDVIDKLERRTVERRQRPRDRRRSEQARFDERSLVPNTVDDGSEPVDDDSRIVKVKRFAIKPIFEEDAISRMEELGHTFFIFVNAESEQVAVLYRRKDGRYGMIEPVIGGGYSSDD